jgi:hypothetical protein
MIVALSLEPKLREWPTVPDEVQSPHGVCSGRTFIISFPLKGDRPA